MALARKQNDKPVDSPEADDGPEAEDGAEPIETAAVTNLLMADITMRAGSQILKSIVERRFKLSSYDPEKAKKILSKRSKTLTATSFTAARIATKSVPGAILVGGGILAKGLFDRSQKRRKRRLLTGPPSAESQDE